MTINTRVKDIVIALDAMGGDNAPSIVLEGASLACQKYPDVKFIIYGNLDILNEHLGNYPLLKNFEVIHCPNSISAHDKPSIAVRNSKDSSMRAAIEAVKDAKANAAISAGNTGALMAISKIILRTLPNISRPAIAGIFPTIKGKTVMLDLGANVECDSEILYQFAVMGDAFAKAILGVLNPKIGLLNIGSEEVKGNDVVKLTWQLLKNNSEYLNFYGYVEGDDITKGTVDVIVTDGFTGNVALKTAEGTAKFIKEIFKEAFENSWISKLSYLLARKSLKKAASRIDGRLYNGAMFLGLNGIIVKSHGSADGLAFSNAISIAIELATQNINQKILEEINIYKPSQTLIDEV